MLPDIHTKRDDIGQFWIASFIGAGNLFTPRTPHRNRVELVKRSYHEGDERKAAQDCLQFGRIHACGLFRYRWLIAIALILSQFAILVY